MELKKLFAEIEENLEASRKVFIKLHLDDDEEDFRSLEESKLILNAINELAMSAHTLFAENSSLESIFEKEFGNVKILFSRDNIIQTCLAENYLIPDAEEFPLPEDHKIDAALLDNYVLSYKDWLSKIQSEHMDTQKLILEDFTLELKYSELECHCVKCSADFRAKLRDFIYKEQIAIIDESIIEIEKHLEESQISYISDYVSKLRKRLDRGLSKVRNRLKRGSVNKLESDVKGHFKRLLGPRSELGLVYRERLKSFYNGILTDAGHSADLITENEYDRFFTQLGIGIWKNPKFLQKDFEKLMRSILAFKRKDISATILREYLGQFWVHAEARKKNRRIIYHMGPTNSGKTYNAIEALAKAKNGSYLAPLRLLASEPVSYTHLTLPTTPYV